MRAGTTAAGTTAVSGIMEAGQDLVAAGYIALKGTSVIAAEKEKELLARFTAQFVKRCQSLYEIRGLFQLPGISASETTEGITTEGIAIEGIATEVSAAQVFESSGAGSWCLAGEGGIMTALWDYFDGFGLGFEMELRRLPILQETVEVCEVFDVNPYRLQSEGCALLTAANGGALVSKLEKKGIHAVVLGRTQTGIKRQIYNGGIQTFLDRPKPDELYKVLQLSPRPDGTGTGLLL